MSALRDVRLGFRMLRKSPALAAVCVLALSLGIGLTTMMFSIIYGALLRGLPYPDGPRIVVIDRMNPSRDINGQSLPIQDFHDVREQLKTVDYVGAYTSGTMNVSGAEKAERYQGSWVSAGLLEMTGVKPLHGRTFRSGEDAPSGNKVAVLSYGLFRNRFGSDTRIIGQSIRVNGVPYEVIGVMPENFRFPADDNLWLPLQTDPLATARGQGQFVQTVAMQRRGVPLDEVNAELAAMSKRLEADFPKEYKGFVMTAEEFVRNYIGNEPRQMLYTMLGAVFFVLLIACTNVANLLLDRAAHRSKEVGVRSALGASRFAIMRVFLSEALTLAVVGTVVGIGIAYAGINIFNRAIADTQPPFFIEIALFPPVLLFAVGVSVIATLCSGMLPALQASRSDISEVLKDESRGSSSLRIGRMSKALVIFEVALSCGLLVAAGLMIKSVVNAGTRDTGYTTSNVFTARVGFPSVYTDTLQQRQFFHQLQERVGALPGVNGVALSGGLPGARQGLGRNQFAIEGRNYERDTDYPDTRTLIVSPSFFETLQIQLRSGRLLDESDREGSLPVAVVNERFVREHLGGKDPLGRRIRFGGAESTQPWLTVVGVVPDIFDGDQDDPRPPIVFRSIDQQHTPFVYVSVRTDRDPMTMTDPVRDVVAGLQPDIPIYWPQTLEKAIAEELWFVRVFGTMFMVFGFVALFLASVGLYAVMSFSVSRRRREVGIRMALGATGGDVVRLIMSQGAFQLVVGLVLGLLLAGGISGLMRVILFDVNPLDPMVFGGVTLVLILTGVTACLLPARRATLVDPSDALRAD